MSARRPVRVGMALLVLLGAAACSGDDDPRRGADGPATARPGGGPAVVTENRRIAGLDVLVVRPSRHGPWPLVVFVHGAGAPPVFYGGLLRDLAAQGRVVIAPAMPGSVDDGGAGALLALPFQPGRVRQVVDAVTAGPERMRSVDPDRIAVAGHSLGAITALAVGYHTCCVDRRIDGVVSIAGQLALFPNGYYGSFGPPLLLIHGDRDETIAYTGSEEAMVRIGSPAYLLTLEGGDHGSYLDVGTRRYPAVLLAIDGFLDATVGQAATTGLADLVAAGNRPGLRLTQGS